jgi:hypothetical protein
MLCQTRVDSHNPRHKSTSNSPWARLAFEASIGLQDRTDKSPLLTTIRAERTSLHWALRLVAVSGRLFFSVHGEEPHCESARSDSNVSSRAV